MDIEVVAIKIKPSRREKTAFLALALLCGATLELGSESLTLTTWYPAPSGVYTQLRVTGSFQLADGTQGNTRVLTSDAAGRATWQAPTAAVPAGAVMSFNLLSCPIGWSAYSAAQGRVIVGAGTVGFTQGAPLADKSIRGITEVPQHAHTIRSANGNPHQVDPNTGSGYALWANVSTSYTDPPSPYAIISGYTGPNSVDVTMPYVQLLICQKN